MIEPGMTLGERYQLTRTLGEGGMANVYLAHDLILDRDVAIKVLRLDLQNDQGTLRRFRREAMATLELNHPHITSIYDVGETDGQQYLVMEYIKGQNLKKYIAANFPIPYAKVIEIMTQILGAVQEAHDHNIIHRDLKPQNIMVEENGDVKIADFGIAVALSDNAMTQTNSLLGSVHYLSPEQARGSMPTRQSDIYALGIILYELLTGSVPFEGDSAVTVALKHFQEEIPSVKAFDPRIPQALENVVLKATAKYPNQRYTSASAMADDLSTSLSPTRASEKRFHPELDDDLGETKVMSDLPSAMRHVQPDDLATKEIPLADTQATQTMPIPEPKNTRKKWWWVAGGLVVLAVIAGLLALIWPKGDVDVPNVTGMTVTEARRALDEVNLNVSGEKTMADEDIASGKVIRTDPQRGISVKSGSSVKLIVSSGAGKITMEDYEGESYSDAAKELRKRGFKVRKRVDNDSTDEPGTVIKQSIPHGRRVVAEGRTVTLTVAGSGEKFNMANLDKYNYQGVMGYAADHNLDVSYTGDTTGLVISQSPAAGTPMTSGGHLDVVFGGGFTDPGRSNESSTDNTPFEDDDDDDQSTSSSTTTSSTSSSAASSSSATTSSSTPSSSTTTPNTSDTPATSAAQTE